MSRTALLASALLLAACGRGTPATEPSPSSSAMTSETPNPQRRTVPVTIESGGKRHTFRAEVAETAAQQAQGLMFRTDLQPDDAMLFAPYPAGGGAPQVADFWMKNTPMSLDILFIRADHSIAAIAPSTTPLSEAKVSSGEPVAAVLELVGGRAAALGIGAGDRVSW
ncbi:DUF192 domain-containing protein [Sphingomonas sp. BK580]|uniref:DUF192 domain-containing protein n=1 Tax=Sphingomonas sp. BK580 TaxID=2586972 RepID=UPI001820FA2A|nr:DUF192 domain-containing protein [Sphingomonas sp. BK580]MBB3694418.1 hypothetical protein [Sphingomonas sp. BK580]